MYCNRFIKDNTNKCVFVSTDATTYTMYQAKVQADELGYEFIIVLDTEHMEYIQGVRNESCR